MAIAGQQHVGLMPHSFLFAWLQLLQGQVLVLQMPEVDVGLQQSTWSSLQRCELFFCDRRLWTAAALHTCCYCCLCGSADHFTQATPITSFPNLGFLTKTNTSFHLKIKPLHPHLIAAKFKTIHPHHVTQRREVTYTRKKTRLTDANGQHHKDKLKLWIMSLVCPLLCTISPSVDRDPSHSQHYLNSGVSVYKCIIQSLANSLESTSSQSHSLRSSKPAGSKLLHSEEQESFKTATSFFFS